RDLSHRHSGEIQKDRGSALGEVTLDRFDRFKLLGAHYACSSSVVSTVAGSIFTPGPMVLEIPTERTYTPLADGGFFASRSSSSALPLLISFSASNDTRPMRQCTTP